MPFASLPTAAKRNSFNPYRRKAKASVLVMMNSQKNMTSNGTSSNVVADTTLNQLVLLGSTKNGGATTAVW
jgi:hypothetical protein